MRRPQLQRPVSTEKLERVEKPWRQGHHQAEDQARAHCSENSESVAGRRFMGGTGLEIGRRLNRQALPWGEFGLAPGRDFLWMRTAGQPHSPQLLATLSWTVTGQDRRDKSCGGLPSFCCVSWASDERRNGHRRPRRVRGSAAAAVLPSLLLRTADPRGRNSVLVAHVSGVRADLGARHSQATVRDLVSSAAE